MDTSKTYFYAGKEYILLSKLPFTDNQYYYKLKEVLSNKILFLCCLGE